MAENIKTVASSRLEILEMLRKKNASILNEFQLFEIAEEGAGMLRLGRVPSLEAKSVILALSMRPRTETFDKLPPLAPVSCGGRLYFTRKNRGCHSRCGQ
jgi:hypothetical protein